MTSKDEELMKFWQQQQQEEDQELAVELQHELNHGESRELTKEIAADSNGRPLRQK